MKNNLPCYIIQDLLPSYIDKLTSKASSEEIKNHIENCENCKKIYEDMSKNYACSGSIETHNSEKNLFRKINNNLNRKTKKVTIISIFAIVFVFILSQLLFTLPVIEIPLKDVTVSAEVYPMKDIVSPYDNNSEEYNTRIYSNDSEKDQTPEFIINIPDSNVKISASESIVNENDYFSVISFNSVFNFKQMNYDFKEANGENIMYITSLKTSVLGNKNKNGNTSTSTIQFEKVDKIVFIDKSGSETVLWTNK